MAVIVSRENRKSFAHKFPYFAAQNIRTRLLSGYKTAKNEEDSFFFDRTEYAFELWRFGQQRALRSLVEEVPLRTFVRFAYARFFARMSQWDR